MTTRVRSTARIGAVSITDKRGNRTQLRPSGTEIPMGRISWYLRSHLDDTHHEHNYVGLFNGSDIQVCACGQVLSQEEFDL